MPSAGVRRIFFDMEPDNWSWFDDLDHEQQLQYVEEHPECVTTFKLHDSVAYLSGVRCTVVGHALSWVSRVSETLRRELIERVSLDDICYVSEAGNIRLDVLSCAVIEQRSVEFMLRTKRLSVPSLLQAIKRCTSRRYVLSMGTIQDGHGLARIFHANKNAMQMCLDQQSNIFAATVWSFRQAFVGDHSTVFDRIAEVWRNGFYSILERSDIK